MDKDSRALRLRTNLYRMYQGQLTFLLGAVGVSLSLPLFALLRPLATAFAGLGLLLNFDGDKQRFSKSAAQPLPAAHKKEPDPQQNLFRPVFFSCFSAFLPIHWLSHRPPLKTPGLLPPSNPYRG